MRDSGLKTLWTPLPPRDFEARRLHNLLLFVEHARNPEERLDSAEYVFRNMRKYLTDFHGLRART